MGSVLWQSLLLAAFTGVFKLVLCADPTIVLPQGTIIGTTTSVPAATAAVNQYLGVPFANPPKRFVPPEPVSGSNSAIIAQNWKPKCIETAVFPPFSDSLPEDESCLYLNIYTPATQSSTKKAVMFWLYGGSLQFGNAGQPLYDGSSFAANQDVIVVTANYRTNIFGFSNSPGLGLSSRNAGLYDQRLALQWVQNNIANFGGDPAKVTIFGESSGASSVDRLLTAPPPGRLPFRAAILQSGQASISLPLGSNGPQNWARVVSAVGCARGSDSEELACMQIVNFSAIKAAVMSQGLSFLPQNDGVTQKSTPLLAARAAGSAANVPMMIGGNGEEAALIVAGLAKQLPTLNASTAETIADSTVGPALSSLARAAINPVRNAGSSAIFFALSGFLTDVIYTCPASQVSKASNLARNPTWRYLFNATFPDTQGILGFDGVPNIGAYHSTEIPIVFGTYSVFSNYAPPTEDEVVLSRFMQRAWANFAKDPVAGPGWIGLLADSQSIGCFGCEASRTGVSYLSSSSLDGPCLIYNALNLGSIPSY